MKEHSGLFRTFAEVATDDGENFVRFATRFGLLGVVAVPARQAGGRDGVTGEPSDTWADEIRALRMTVFLWDLFQRGDAEGLAGCIHWASEAGGPVVYYHPPLDLFPDIPVPARGLVIECTPIAAVSGDPDLLGRFRQGDTAAPALAYVQRQINGRLESHTRARLSADPDTGRMSVEATPVNLLGAIWLQFARAVGEGKTYRRCRACTEWFELTRDGGRQTRQFCSNACRSKAYRDRQDRARDLHAGGKSYREIAEELESDVAAVKRWVGGGTG